MNVNLNHFKLTWDDSWILILLHVCLFAAMSQRMLAIFSDSVVKLHLNIKILINGDLCWMLKVAHFINFCKRPNHKQRGRRRESATRTAERLKVCFAVHSQPFKVKDTKKSQV